MINLRPHKIKFYLPVLGLITLAALGLATAARATDQTASTFGTTVSPPSFELDATPGQVLHESVKVTNGSDADLTYLASVADFHVQGIEGDVAIDDTDTTPYAASKWIGLSQTSFHLVKKDTAVINFIITVPTNAEPGGHYAAVLFQPKLSSGPEGSGAATIPRIGSLVLIRLPGAAAEQATIEQLTPKSYVGGWDSLLGTDGKTTILAPKNENLNAEHPQRFFLSGQTIAFDALFKDLGTVHVKPVGTVVITNLFGQTTTELALNPKNVFPGGERRVSIIWPGHWHWGLLYHAKLTALYGASNQVVSSETWFIAFPLPAIVAILVLLVLMALAHRRLKRIIRVIIKGQ